MMQPEFALSGRQQERGGGDGGARRLHRSAPSGDGFRRWGGMEGCGAGSRAGGLRWGIVNGENLGGVGCGEPLLVLVLNWLWHDRHYIRE